MLNPPLSFALALLIAATSAKNASELFAPAMDPITIQVVESEGKVTALKTSNGREYVRLSE